jgi:beta-lactamase regulating signal transducer with metallopeptidase domain
VIARPAVKLDAYAIALYGWLAGVCLFGARLFWTHDHFRSRISGYQPVVDANVMRVFEDCRASLKITQAVRLIETVEVESPAVYGLWRKWLLLPDGVFERFSTRELRCIFLHELAHIKRGDLAVNWLVSVLQVAHWFNPVLWLAFARMRADREQAADALALAHVAETENIAYGETILKVVENLAGSATQPGLVGIAESKAGLIERLRAISRFGAVRPWKWAAIGVAIGLAAVGLTDARQETARVVPRNDSGGFATKQATEISGEIVDPDGRPVSDAQVALFKPGSGLYLSGTPRLFNPAYPHLMGEPRREDLPWNYCTTDEQGRFDLNDLAGSLFLLAANERGFAQIPTNDFATNMVVRLEPWGRIDGTVWDYEKVAAHEPVSVGMWPDDGAVWTRNSRFYAITDSHGHFSFDYCPPGRFSIVASGISEKGAIKSGETTVVKIGGDGRPVIGRFKFADPHVKIEWGKRRDFYCFFPEAPRPSQPFKTEEEYSTWLSQPKVWDLFKSRKIDLYSVRCAEDGSFRIDQVEPGNYAMAVSLRDPTEPYGRKLTGQHRAFNQSFEVPASKSNLREPLDLGVIEISPKTNPTPAANTQGP